MHYISTWSWDYVPDDLYQHPQESSTVHEHTASPHAFSFPTVIICIFPRFTFSLPEPMFPALMENWMDLRMFVFPKQTITWWMTDGSWDINIAASLPHKARKLWGENFIISPDLSHWCYLQIPLYAHQEVEYMFSSFVSGHIFVTASRTQLPCRKILWGPCRRRKRWPRGPSSSP